LCRLLTRAPSPTDIGQVQLPVPAHA